MAIRDYVAVPYGEDTLVVTCDSIGSIGEMELDELKVTPNTVGRFLARVALMELLSAGAELIALSCTFSIDPLHAEPIIHGILTEARLVHDTPETIMVMSTEQNMPSKQTGVGITCIGYASKLRRGSAQPGDVVVACGIPKVGAEVSLCDPDNATIAKLLQLLQTPGVADIAPAGSKGILYEAQALAQESRLVLYADPTNPQLHKSAGPATALVFACRPDAYATLASRVTPLSYVGILR